MDRIKIPTPEKMQKYPWGVTVVSLFACVIMLLYVVLKKGDCEDCEKRYETERNKNDILTTALLIKNGIILNQEQKAKEKDSTINEKLNKSKDIVKKDK